jgi:sugar O-acyltransferase (sialic acid O-acetyltransferase NeuD family)
MSDSLLSIVRCGVFGTGGFARELAWHLMDAEFVSDKTIIQNDVTVKFLSEIDESFNHINGFEVISEQEFFKSATSGTELFVIAVGENSKRIQLVKKSKDKGLHPIGVISRFARVGYSVILGDGIILCPGVTIMPNVVIGNYFQGHLNSYVAHDCVIGDFVTLLPGAICSGRVEIKNNVTIGAGASIKNGSRLKPLTIGEGSIVGIGAVVTKDVPSGCVVVGNPAKIVRGL